MMQRMRTTFTPAPDVADKLYAMAKESNKSLNLVVNELLRTALYNKEPEKPRKPFKVQAFDLGPINPEFAGLTPKEILAKLDEEEDRARLGL